MGLVASLNAVVLRPLFCLFVCVLLTCGVASARTTIATLTDNPNWSTYYKVPASNGFGGKCNECHTSDAAGTLAGPANADGPLATALQNGTYGVNGATSDALFKSQITKAIDDLYAPLLSAGTTITLDKSAPSGTTVGPVNLQSVGQKAFKVASPEFQAAYAATLISNDTARFSIPAGSGTSRLLKTVGSKQFANQYGSVIVVVTATNSEGLQQSVNKTASYTITLANNLPADLTTKNYLVAQAGTTSNFPLLANDPDGDTLHFSGLAQVTSNGGSATVNDAGQVNFTPPAVVPAGYTEDFTVILSNKNGSTVIGSTAPFTFSVKASAGTNNPPIAITQTFNILEDATVSGTIASDIDAGTTFAFASGGNPVTQGTAFNLPHGQITISPWSAGTSQFTYTGTFGDPGNDTFSYTVTDNGGKTASGTLTFAKTPVVHPPTVIAGSPFLVQVNVVTG